MRQLMNGSQESNSTAIPSEQVNDGSLAITPELVQEVTEKVYALLMQELKLERERVGRLRHHFKAVGGRWC